MSLLSLYSSNVKRKREELARLKKERVRYVNDISNASQKITRLSSQIRGTKSLSTIKSKTNEIEREEKKKTFNYHGRQTGWKNMADERIWKKLL